MKDVLAIIGTIVLGMMAVAAAVYNWLGNDKKRLMPKHWRMILENKIAAK